MPSARFWLFLLLGQIAVLWLLAWLGEARTPASLRWLGIACIVGIFLTAPALMIKAFVSGQRRIGNTQLPMVRGVERNEVALTVGAWVLMGAALAMAWPTIKREISAERQADAVAGERFLDSALRAPLGMTEVREAPRAPIGMTKVGEAPPVPIGMTSSDAQPRTGAPVHQRGSAPASTNLHSSDAGAQDPVVTPGPGSPERAAILDAVRTRLKTKSRFRIGHIRMAGEWAFVRATEVVQLEGYEEQETDLTVEALLEKPKASTTGWWRIADYWTLPENDQRPRDAFIGRVKQRIAVERLPVALLPEDL